MQLHTTDKGVVGVLEGDPVGVLEGDPVGVLEGDPVGVLEGDPVGVVLEGDPVGGDVTISVGSPEGANDSMDCGTYPPLSRRGGAPSRTTG
eukprot:gene18642-biopygen16419